MNLTGLSPKRDCSAKRVMVFSERSGRERESLPKIKRTRYDFSTLTVRSFVRCRENERGRTVCTLCAKPTLFYGVASSAPNGIGRTNQHGLLLGAGCWGWRMKKAFLPQPLRLARRCTRHTRSVASRFHTARRLTPPPPPPPAEYLYRVLDLPESRTYFCGIHGMAVSPICSAVLLHVPRQAALTTTKKVCIFPNACYLKT